MESRQDLAQEAASIVVFGLAVFCLVAIVTYSPADPSFFSNATGSAANACGKVGAHIASLLLECFGIAAFLFPAALGFMASVVLKKEGSVKLFGVLGGMTVAVMSATVFLTLQWKYWPYSGSLILTGGAFGAWLASKLAAQFNHFGGSLVSLLVFALSIAVSTPISVARGGAWAIKWVSKYFWHFGKLFATFVAYFAGLIAMRSAHAAGDLIQKMIESAIRSARERSAERARLKGTQTVLEDGGSATKKREPIVGMGDKDTAEDAELVTAGENGVLLDSDDEEPTAALARTSVTEAPNVFPELELKPKIAPAPLSSPEIVSAKQLELPVHSSAELDAQHKIAEAAAKKAEAKLAKLSRGKRGQWKLPPVDFLRKVPKVESSIDREKLIQNSQILTQKFLDFGIEGEVTAVRPGPVITLYEFKPGPGVKVSRIASLADDLSMALSAQSVRILAPLPGKSVVGIEIPSEKRENVFLREFIQNPDFTSGKHLLPVVMGKDIAGQPYLSDLSKMPHLLCAGQTGSGKSVFMNGLICSLLYRFTPDELRMILVDPKFIEFRSYQDIPQLLLPVVDDPKHAAIALKWAVREMERRYRILAMMGVRNLAAFNEKVDSMGVDVVQDLLLSEENQQEGQEKMAGGDWLLAFEPDETGAPRIGKLPYIMIIIDELADLMMVAKKEVEISIARIAQKARAAGIHLVIATQRPSTDVVTGLIKANLPSRVSFSLASYIDSKTILDRQGAERLLGRGDMLFIAPGTSQLTRLHGAYVDDEEINKIASFLRDQGKPAYRDEILTEEEEDSEDGNGDANEEDDELFQEAVELVKRSGHASASFLQRHLKVGYNRAARMIETMEMRGVVGPADGARPREVLVR